MLSSCSEGPPPKAGLLTSAPDATTASKRPRSSTLLSQAPSTRTRPRRPSSATRSVALSPLARAQSGGGGSHRSRSSAGRRPSIGRARGQSYSEIEHEDPLDRHVVDCLTKRQQVKRALKGVGKFLCTPVGVVVGFYGEQQQSNWQDPFLPHP